MALEQSLITKLAELISEADDLSRAMPGAPTYSRGAGWVASMTNAVELICRDEGAPYRRAVDSVLRSKLAVQAKAGAIAEVLRRLLDDAQRGLLASVADHARAEVFDDFLDSAREYCRKKLHREAGVIAGVVFEDTVRRLCDKLNIPQKDVQLDQLITALTSAGTITAAKAKRARGGAHVRTKATHAQWDEFDLGDVDATISVTEELIERLDS